MQRRRKTVMPCILTMLVAIFLFLGYSTPVYAQHGCGYDWTCQVVDPGPESAGTFASLDFDASGRPAVSYFDDTNDDLRFAYDRNNDGDFSDAGEIMTVDSAGWVGLHTSLAFGSGPAISYHHEGNDDLMFAYDRNNDGDFADAGEMMIVDAMGSTGECTSLAFNPAGGPAIAYEEYYRAVRFAYDRNNDGVFEIVDVSTYSAGNPRTYPSVAFDPSGRPAISFYRPAYNEFGFAHDLNDDGDFSDAGENIVFDSDDSGWPYTSLAFDQAGRPAIGYRVDAYGGGLKFAYDRNNNGIFSDPGEIITVDSVTASGGYTSVAFDAYYRPAISYYTNTGGAGDLIFVWDLNNDGDFADVGEVTNVHSADNNGLYSSLAFDMSGRPAIGYYGSGADPKLARYTQLVPPPPPSIRMATAYLMIVITAPLLLTRAKQTQTAMA